MKKELTESVREFYEDFDIIRSFILVFDIKGNVRNINKTGCEILGVKKSNIIGKDWFRNFISPKFRKLYRKLFIDALTVTKSLEESFENPILCRKGNERIIVWHPSFIKDEQGEIIGMLCSGEDVTEHRIAERKLKESEENYRTLIDNIYQVTFHVDFPNNLRKIYPKLNPKFVSDSVIDLTGYTAAEFRKGRTYLNYRIHPEDRDKTAKAFWKMVRTKKSISRVYRFEHKNGTYKWFEDSLVPKLNDKKKIIGCIGVISNITQQKKALSTIQDYETFFEMSQDMLCIAGTDGFFKKINPSFSRELGYSEKHLLSKPFVHFVHPEDVDKTLNELAKLSDGEITIHFENRYRCKNGRYKWLSWTSSPAIKSQLVYAVARDISQEKNTEEELRKNEAFLNSVVENIPNMIFVKDAKELRFVRFNKAGEELLGYTRTAMIGKNDYDFFPKEEADHFSRYDQSVLKKRKLVDIPEEEIETRKKGLRILHTKKIPLYDQKGKPEYLLGISEDITEAKQAQESLEKSEEKYREIVHLVQEGVWMIDTNDITTFANEEMGKILGYKAEEMIGRPVYDFMDKEGIEINKINVKRRKQGLPEHDYKFKTKKGEDKWTILKVRPVKDNKGRQIGSIASVVDVSERRKAEQLIRENVQKLNEAQKIANLGSWEFDVKTKSITWSEETYRLFGLSPDHGKITQEHFRKFIHPDDREVLIHHIENAITKGIPFEMEMRIVWPDRSVHYVAGRGRPVKRNNKVEKLVGIGMDITERKLAESQVMNALLKGQDSERRRIADDLHDSLGQKLSAIKLFVENNYPAESKPQMNYSGKLESLLDETIEEVRNISHNLMPAGLNDFGLKNSLSRLCDKTNKNNGTSVTFHAYGVNSPIDPSLEFGMYRITQELLTNALKHSKAKEVNIQLFMRNKKLILTVEDDGKGFNTENINLDKSFGLNSITSRAKGLNGIFNLDSHPGNGTIASIEIPLKS